MDFDAQRAVAVPGDGVVVRHPGLVCVARCADQASLRHLLDLCAGVAGPDPGRLLARRLASWLAGPEAPADGLVFGTIAAAGPQLAVFLSGDAAVVVPDSGIRLSGADAAAWTDRLLNRPGAPIVLTIDGAACLPTTEAGVYDLRGGVVPGAAVVLVPPASEPVTASESAAIEWFAAAEPVPYGADAAEPGTAGPGPVADGGSVADPAIPLSAVAGPAVAGGAVPGSGSVADPGPVPGPAVPGPADPGPVDAGPAVPDAAVPGPTAAGVGAGDRPRPGPGLTAWVDLWDGTRIAKEEAGSPGKASPRDRGDRIDLDQLPGDQLPGDQLPGDQLPGDPIPGDRVGSAPRPAADATPAVPVEAPSPPPADAARTGPGDDAGRPATTTGRHAAIGHPEPGAGQAPEVDSGLSGTGAAASESPEISAAGPAPEAAAVEHDRPAVPVTERSGAPDPSTDEGGGPGAAPDAPQNRGRRCAHGHPTDPGSAVCGVCGIPTGERSGGRRSSGRLVFDDGATYPVDAGYLVGRKPDADPRVRSGALRSIVVDDPSGAVSRVHVEVRLDGRDVLIQDSGSRNGTFVAAPGEAGWTPLSADRPWTLAPGTRVRMGGRMFVFETQH